MSLTNSHSRGQNERLGSAGEKLTVEKSDEFNIKALGPVGAAAPRTCRYQLPLMPLFLLVSY